MGFDERKLNYAVPVYIDRCQIPAQMIEYFQIKTRMAKNRLILLKQDITESYALFAAFKYPKDSKLLQ